MTSPRLPAAVAAAGAALLLAFPPAAHAASVRTDTACDQAVSAAATAEHDYEALKNGIQRQVADGGHPDQSQLQALQDADARRVAAATQAQRLCGS
ncbi:hypothetical protein [Streptomyces sp. NPDC001135]